MVDSSKWLEKGQIVEDYEKEEGQKNIDAGEFGLNLFDGKYSFDAHYYEVDY